MSDIERVVMVCFFLVSFPVLMLAFVLILRKTLEWMEDRGWIMYFNDSPTYGTLASAFLELQSMAQPEMQYVLEVRQEQEMKQEEDGQAGSDTAGV